MDERDERFEFLEEQQGQRDGLLDRIDRALVKAGRALWRCIVDGFAAYGASECGLSLDPAFESPRAWEAGLSEIGTYPYQFGIVGDDDLRSDYADIDELIRALQSVGD